MTSQHPAIRKILRAHPDGLTIAQIGRLIGVGYDTVRGALNAMPDVYIDRWEKSVRSFTAVWVAVVPPANCPRPK